MFALLTKEKVKSCLRKYMELIQTKSLQAAAREQRLEGLAKKLQVLVPSISDQYTSF